MYEILLFFVISTIFVKINATTIPKSIIYKMTDPVGNGNIIYAII